MSRRDAGTERNALETDMNESEIDEQMRELDEIVQITTCAPLEAQADSGEETDEYPDYPPALTVGALRDILAALPDDLGVYTAGAETEVVIRYPGRRGGVDRIVLDDDDTPHIGESEAEEVDDDDDDDYRPTPINPGAEVLWPN